MCWYTGNSVGFSLSRRHIECDDTQIHKTAIFDFIIFFFPLFGIYVHWICDSSTTTTTARKHNNDAVLKWYAYVFHILYVLSQRLRISNCPSVRWHGGFGSVTTGNCTTTYAHCAQCTRTNVVEFRCSVGTKYRTK